MACINAVIIDYLLLYFNILIRINKLIIYYILLYFILVPEYSKKNSSGFLEFSLIMNLDISQLLEDNNDNDSETENDDFYHFRKRRCMEEPSVWDKTK